MAPAGDHDSGDPDLRLKITPTGTASTAAATGNVTIPDFFPDLYDGYLAAKPPDYVFETMGPLCMGILWFLVALCTLVVIGRLWTRYKITRIVGLEDWLMPVSLIFMIGNTAIFQDMASKGILGRHIWDIKFRTPTMADQIIFALSQGFYNLSTATTRLAILVFIRRLNPYQTFNRIVLVNIAINIFFPIFAICTLVFRCSPIRAGFEPVLILTDNVHCIPSNRYGKALMSLSLILDIVTWLLPVTLVYRVPADLKKKLIMGSIMSLGLLACIASALRIPATFIVWKSEDVFWDNVKLTIFMQLEMGIGIMAACGPAMKPLCEHLYGLAKTALGGKSKKCDSTQSSGEYSGPMGTYVVTMELNPQVVPQSAGRRGLKAGSSSSTDRLYMAQVLSRESDETENPPEQR